jgi:hypothetical protein
MASLKCSMAILALFTLPINNANAACGGNFYEVTTNTHEFLVKSGFEPSIHDTVLSWIGAKISVENDENILKYGQPDPRSTTEAILDYEKGQFSKIDGQLEEFLKNSRRKQNMKRLLNNPNFLKAVTDTYSVSRSDGC